MAGTKCGWVRQSCRRPPRSLPLLFEAVELPAGIQRLRLELMLRLQSPTRRAPALEIRSPAVSRSGQAPGNRP